MGHEELIRREEKRPLSAYAGVDVVSQYVSRGLDEPSLQPWFELDVPFLRFLLLTGTRFRRRR